MDAGTACGSSSAPGWRRLRERKPTYCRCHGSKVSKTKQKKKIVEFCGEFIFKNVNCLLPSAEYICAKNNKKLLKLLFLKHGTINKCIGLIENR